MINLSEVRGGLLVLAGLIVVVLAVIVATPGLPGELLLQSLRFHVLAAGGALFVTMRIFRLHWRSVVFLMVLVAVTVQSLLPMLEMHARRDVAREAPQTTTLDVLSYNVLTGNLRADEAARYIIDSAPDVAVIMETPGIADYLEAISAVLPYRFGCERPASCDLSILSKYPFEDQQSHRFWPFRLERFMSVRIVKDDVPVTVFGAHFSKPYFDRASWGETEQLVRVLGRIEGRVVLTGDFNAAPWSDPLEYLVRQASLIPGPSHPATWPIEAGPLGVPIDNMFTRGDARILDIAAGEDSFGSNHRFLRATVGL